MRQFEMHPLITFRIRKRRYFYCRNPCLSLKSKLFQGCKSGSNPYFCGLQMKTKSLQRAILLASGICAVLVILISQSFYQTSSAVLKSKTEKSKETKEVTIHAPADVASQGHSVELNEQQPSHVEEELVLSDKKNQIVVYLRKTTLNFFKTLFRVIISPNAP